ncbi:unnamed protein product [Durusdinium trenchii]|uniref:Uncharacterized protein n=1 Tax=Durusdinium trenchii TaxID=1381693 RepID=A0ABP0PG46_9DINO
MLMTVVTFIVWRSKSRIFVDILCMEQHNPKLKAGTSHLTHRYGTSEGELFKEDPAEGLLNIGGILKHSESLHVFWDHTWISRLWCVFELAAFLKCQEGKEGNAMPIFIRPVTLGPCSMMIFFACFFTSIGNLNTPFLDSAPLLGMVVLTVSGMACWIAAIRFLRAHWASLESTLDQLSSFKLEKTSCFCCTKGHQQDNGAMMVCDRQVIMHCITHWFDSIEAFEETVKTEISKAMRQQLGHAFTSYSWLVLVGLPFHWMNMDQIATRLRCGNVSGAAVVGVINLTWCLFSVPWILRTTVMATYLCRRRRSNWISEQLVNLGLYLLITFFAAFILALQLLATEFPDLVQGSVFFVAVNLLIFSLATCRCQDWARDAG